VPTIFDEETWKRLGPGRPPRRGKRRSRFRRLLKGVGWLAGLGIATGAAGYYWYLHRPRPSNLRQTLFQGITYIRDVRDAPRPLVIHAAVVNLDAPGLRFLVTHGDPKQKMPLRARTTSQFLEEFKLQFAVNAGFFTPWHSNAPWDYYPHVGDGVVPDGFTASRGVVYARTTGPITWPTLHISKKNRARFNEPDGLIYNAITGGAVLLKDGEIQKFKHEYQQNPEPRTAIGLSEDRKKLVILVVDGRQPNYSEGINYPEMARLMKKYGAYDAMNLDGGGSSTMVAEGAEGKPDVLNCPKRNWFPYQERPVANHLGIYANQVGN